MSQPNQFNPAYVGSRSDVRNLVPQAVNKLLDVGCSNGSLGKQLKQDIPELTVHGIDYDEAMLRVAEKSLDKACRVDLNERPIQTDFLEKYQCILFADILEHLAYPTEILSHFVENHLAPDGCVVVSVPNASHLTMLFSLLKCRLPARDRGIFDRTHLRWFCKANVYELAESVGMVVVDMKRNYRFRDQPGGKLNRMARPIGQVLWPFREFLAYQYVVRFEYRT
ncbi:class I SAM-dependent methyltransferase [Mariniblastus fucicola]|uniref:Bifunctional 3-demethylubiquinone-9 3-methyltransferase/ 2-octaprenyl-6-hydroxy phenol methylase n=1 Tax=Mariniblastus fucicola TaxID=980251 RepID=A0A5B9P5U1_9BACT|nr:class I SAM-dependent methyltransferase [Mariniblastus fucicola]QEG20290.1 bifunctional 3-demethylubiquinone-9 3-methyltransferase/ 2-octaprenyl-6-hydroxy phenol methylase [Mariniblastus fucicola]